jgi:hypothetical protein
MTSAMTATAKVYSTFNPDEYELLEPGDTHSQPPRPELTRDTECLADAGSFGLASRAGWGLEIVSSLCSLAMLAAIISILWKMDGKLIDEWRFQISLGATVALLATLCSAAMMHNVSSFIGQLKWLHLRKKSRKLEHLQIFDEASRGPYGSAIFLYKIKCNIATIGALITIFRLVFSPLVQEAIGLPQSNIEIDDLNATLTYSHSYVRNISTNDTMNTAYSKMISCPWWE